MSWQYLDQTEPKARKDYCCSLCALTIPKGTVHVKRVGISEGEWVNMRMHPDCEVLTRDWDEMDWECHDEATFRGWKEEIEQAKLRIRGVI